MTHEWHMTQHDTSHVMTHHMSWHITCHDTWHKMTHDMTWHDMTWHDTWHYMTYDMTHYTTWCMTWHDTWHDTWHNMMHDSKWHMTHNMTWHMTWRNTWCMIQNDKFMTHNKWHMKWDDTWHNTTWYDTWHDMTHDTIWHMTQYNMTSHDITWQVTIGQVGSEGQHDNIITGKYDNRSGKVRRSGQFRSSQERNLIISVDIGSVVRCWAQNSLRVIKLTNRLSQEQVIIWK